MSENNDTVTAFFGMMSRDDLIRNTLQSIIVAALTGAEVSITVDHPEIRGVLQEMVDSAVKEGVINAGQVSIELIP